MYFLDANAFYSYFGRGRLGMTSSPVDEKVFEDYLNKITNKSLPTSVFIEIVTHFRNNSKLLKEIITFITKNKLRLYNNIPDYCVSPDELTCVCILDDVSLSNYANNMMSKKIDIEAKFVFTFYEITRDLYTHYKIESIQNLSKTQKQSIMSYIGRKGFDENIKQKFVDELKSGYEQNDEKKAIKDCYIKELNEACLISDIIVEGCRVCEDQNVDIIEHIKNIYQTSINSGLDGKNTTMKYINSAFSTDEGFLTIAKAKIAGMFRKGKYTNSQIKYLQDVMFTAWYNREQKLQKNDIFDMFCVGCMDVVEPSSNACILKDTTSYLISFDKVMKKFIGEVKPTNLQIIENLQNTTI